MERTTHEITTPGGFKVVVKDYLTGSEVNAVLTDLFKSQEISADDESPKISISSVFSAM
jgi:hypothetical protein